MNDTEKLDKINAIFNQQGWTTNVDRTDFDAKPKQTLKEIQNIFFGLSKGDLPDEINELKNQYIKDKKSLGFSCKKCELTALINRYKKRVTNIVNHS